jgi:septum formation protein
MMGLKDLYDVIHSPLDESALQSQLYDEESGGMPEPKTYTRVLAEEKAKALAMEISSQVTQPTIVLGSDTIVAFNDSILEKPKDTADAKIMLTQLSGNEHTVHTGVAMYRVLPQALSDEPVTLVASFVDTANVRFAPLSGTDIDMYIATGEPMDKAGSYGIQGIGGQLVSSMEGDFFTVRPTVFFCLCDYFVSPPTHRWFCFVRFLYQVMGLPMHRTSRQITLAISEILELVNR